MNSYVSADMLAAVGSVLDTKVSYPISSSDIRKWAVAVHWPLAAPARYLDPAVEVIKAPTDLNPFAWCVASTESSTTVDPFDPDFTEKSLGLPNLNLRNQLNGGVKIQYGDPMYTGDIVTSRRSLSGYDERAGRAGPMLFTYLLDVWTNQHGCIVKSTTMTLIRY